MAYIVDIIIVVIFGAVVFLSYKKGFFASLFDLIGTILGIIAARILSQQFAPEVFERFVRAGAENTLAGSLGEIGTTDYALQAEQALNSIPEAMNGIMSLIGIDKQVILDKIAASNVSGDNLVETLMINVVEPIGTAVVQFILFALMALVFAFLIKIVVKILDKIIKVLPVIKRFNSGLGIVFGVVRGFIVVIIVSMVIGVVASFISNETFIDAVNNSIIVSTIQSLISSISGATV